MPDGVPLTLHSLQELYKQQPAPKKVSHHPCPPPHENMDAVEMDINSTIAAASFLPTNNNAISTRASPTPMMIPLPESSGVFPSWIPTIAASALEMNSTAAAPDPSPTSPPPAAPSRRKKLAKSDEVLTQPSRDTYRRSQVAPPSPPPLPNLDSPSFFLRPSDFDPPNRPCLNKTRGRKDDRKNVDIHPRRIEFALDDDETVPTSNNNAEDELDDAPTPSAAHNDNESQSENDEFQSQRASFSDDSRHYETSGDPLSHDLLPLAADPATQAAYSHDKEERAVHQYLAVHNAMGHPNYKRMKFMWIHDINNMRSRLPLFPSLPVVCSACDQAKMRRLGRGHHRIGADAVQPGDLVSADTFTFGEDVIGGYRSGIFFVDKCTDYMNVIFSTAKAPSARTVIDAFNKTRALYKSHGHPIKEIRADSGSYFKGVSRVDNTNNDAFMTYLEALSPPVVLRLSSPHSSYQNFCETSLRSLYLRVKTNLVAAASKTKPSEFYKKALANCIAHSVEQGNHTIVNNNKSTPHELFTGKSFNNSIREWYSPVTVFDPVSGKHTGNSQRGYYIGLTPNRSDDTCTILLPARKLNGQVISGNSKNKFSTRSSRHVKFTDDKLDPDRLPAAVARNSTRNENLIDWANKWSWNHRSSQPISEINSILSPPTTLPTNDYMSMEGKHAHRDPKLERLHNEKGEEISYDEKMTFDDLLRVGQHNATNAPISTTTTSKIFSITNEDVSITAAPIECTDPKVPPSYVCPNNFHEACKDIFQRQWHEAMDIEIDTLFRMGAFSLISDREARGISRDTSSKPVPLTWSYRVKKENGKFVKFKARLCLRGDLQKDGELANKDLYSPVIRQDSVRMLLSHALENDFLVHTYDVPCAYLFAKPSQPTVVYSPPQIRQRGRFMRLLKNLYGGIESAQTWNNHLHDKLVNDLGLIQSIHDPCIYFNEDRSVFMAVYVDDILLCAKDDATRIKYDERLVEMYNIKKNGPLDNFLGVSYTRTPENSFFLSQAGTIADLAAIYDRTNAPTAPTPYKKSGVFDMSKTTADPIEIKKLFEDERCELPRLVGSLLHIAKNSRPDIETAVSRVARYVSKPSKEIIDEGIRILDYLKSTPELGLHIRPHNKQPIEAYVDSSYITEKQIHGCSRYGYVIYINGTPITTKSTHHNTASYSTTEAEYIALGMAHRTIIPLNHLYAEFLNVKYSKNEFQNNLHVHIYEDNKPAIGVLTHKQIQNTKLRNVLAYQFKLREDYDNKSLTVSLCTSAEQLADIFTKTTQSRELFSNIRNFLVRPKNISDFVEFRNNNGSSDLLLKKFEKDFGKFSKAVISSDDSGGYDASPTSPQLPHISSTDLP